MDLVQNNDQSSYTIKMLDRIKSNAFKRKAIATLMSEEFAAKSSQLKEKIRSIKDGTDIVINSLKNSKEYYRKWFKKLEESKINDLETERQKEIEKYNKMFEENERKITKQYEIGIKKIEEKKRIELERIENEYKYFSYTLDPKNSVSYQIIEAVKSSGVDPSFIFQDRDFSKEFEIKSKEGKERLELISKKLEEKKKLVEENAIKQRQLLDTNFVEFRKRVKEKENLIISKINENYNNKIDQVKRDSEKILNKKLESIDKVISSLETKRANAVSRLEKDMAALTNEFKLKLMLLMDPNNLTLDDVFSSYLYSKIEVKKPAAKQPVVTEKKEEVSEKENKQVTNIEVKQSREEKSKQIAQRDKEVEEQASSEASKSIEDKGKNAENVEIRSKTISDKADLGNKNHFGRRAISIIRTAFYTVAISSAFIIALTSKLQTPVTQVRITPVTSTVVMSSSTIVSEIKRDIEQNESKKPEIEEVKKAQKDQAANKEDKVTTPADKEKPDNIKTEEIKTKTSAKHKSDLNSVSPLDEILDFNKQLIGYSDVKSKYEASLAEFKEYINGMKHSFKAIIGIKRDDKFILKESLEKLEDSSLSKKKMEALIPYLRNAKDYDARELSEFINNVIETNENKIFGVNPKGDYVILMKTPAKKQSQFDTVNKEVAETKSSEVKASNSDSEKENVNTNVSNEEAVEIKEAKESKEQKNENKGGDETISNFESVEYIITCNKNGEDRAVLVKATPGIIEDNDPTICGQ